jgi:hypothetical protein
MAATRRVMVLGLVSARVCLGGATKHWLQLGISDDFVPALRILAAVLPDVGPELAGRLGAGVPARSDPAPYHLNHDARNHYDGEKSQTQNRPSLEQRRRGTGSSRMTGNTGHTRRNTL